MRLEYPDLLVPEVVADRADDANVGEEAGGEGKWLAEPPSMRSRSPNGVRTASKAMDPTTVSVTGRGTLAARGARGPNTLPWVGREASHSAAWRRWPWPSPLLRLPPRNHGLRLRAGRSDRDQAVVRRRRRRPRPRRQPGHLQTNHKFRSVFLRNVGGRSFHDEINLMGLGPDPQFPASTSCGSFPDATPGVYIWPTDEPGDAGQPHLLDFVARLRTDQPLHAQGRRPQRRGSRRRRQLRRGQPSDR